MDNIPNPRSKKRSRGSHEDLISKLPDSLLQHILSFVSTRDAIRTSLSSRRWQNLWMLVPCLDLDSEQFDDENVFYNFMDRFLYLRGNSPLKKFKLNYTLPKCRNSHFKSWIDAAIKCKVEHLEVESYYESEFVSSVDDGVGMPQSLYICKTLVVLKLADVDNFDIPNRVSLPNLKIMHLTDVRFANDIAFESLISGCPVFEELSIHREYEDNIKVLCISSRTLKQLIVNFMRDVGGKEYGVVIDAPNLEYLKLRDLESKSFIITNIGSSSLKACLDVEFGRDSLHKLEADDFSLRSNICRLFTGICNARSLIIHFYAFELLCKYRQFEAIPQFHNLIHLEAGLSRPACKMLPTILECCPNLKFLILKIHNTIDLDPPRLSPAAPQRMLSSLESITLSTPIIGCRTEMNLIKYFLRKAPILKEMKVNLDKNLTQENESLIFKELLMFPRQSKACQVHVEQFLYF